MYKVLLSLISINILCINAQSFAASPTVPSPTEPSSTPNASSPSPPSSTSSSSTQLLISPERRAAFPLPTPAPEAPPCPHNSRATPSLTPRTIQCLRSGEHISCTDVQRHLAAG